MMPCHLDLSCENCNGGHTVYLRNHPPRFQITIQYLCPRTQAQQQVRTFALVYSPVVDVPAGSVLGTVKE
jgi:hypothetical protein